MPTNLIWCEQVASSNDSIRHFPPNTFLIAAHQSNGRGRQGNKWLSEEGGLYLSYKFILADYMNVSLLPAQVAIACHKALDELNPHEYFLKWPNDILNSEGKKLAGILLERIEQNIIVGIGINCASNESITDFAHLKEQTEPLWLSYALAEEFPAAFKLKSEEVINYWKQKSFIKSQDVISVELPDGNKVEGKYEGLGPEGELRLLANDGQALELVSGEVKKVYYFS